MNHMMVDLETLDTRPSTVILSIGAVIFNENEIFQDPYYRCCEWGGQLLAGRTVSASTLQWWMQQSDAARAALFNKPISLSAALNDLSALYRGAQCERIWANGQSFDISILDHAYGYAGVPWKYNAPRDMRTLKDLVSDMPLPGDVGTAHNALDDATYQARIVMNAWVHIGDLRSQASAYVDAMKPYASL